MIGRFKGERKYPWGHIKRTLLKALETDRGLSTVEVIARCPGLDERTVRGNLSCLVSQGWIENVGGWSNARYKLPKGK